MVMVVLNYGDDGDNGGVDDDDGDGDDDGDSDANDESTPWRTECNLQPTLGHVFK